MLHLLLYIVENLVFLNAEMEGNAEPQLKPNRITNNYIS